MTQHERTGRDLRWLAIYVASSFLGLGTAQLVVGLITAFEDHGGRTRTGAIFMILGWLVVLIVRWRRWPRVAPGREMQPAEARRVVSVVTAAYGLLAAIALIEGVVSHRGIVVVQVVAFGALAVTGWRKLQSRRAAS